MADVVTGFADRLRTGPTAFCAWVATTDPFTPEVLAREGFDAVILDIQHGLHTVGSTIQAIGGAALAGKATMVRVGVEEFPDGCRYLDSGAAGVIAPMINTIEDANRFASFMKYPPQGERSWGPNRALALMGGAQPMSYLKSANSSTVAIAMVETRAALAILDDILAVEGIDGVFVGPSDLSIALSDGQLVNAASADVDEALTHVVARARAAGKLAGAFCMDGQRAGEMAQRGFHFASVGTDVLLLRAGAQQHLAKAKGVAAEAVKGGY